MLVKAVVDMGISKSEIPSLTTPASISATKSKFTRGQDYPVISVVVAPITYRGIELQ
jgi:hypothetical protein